MSRPRVRKAHDLPSGAILQGLRVIDAVRIRDQLRVAEALTHLTRQQLYAVVISLAAMVPDDLTPSEMLAWNDEAYHDRLDGQQRPLEPHGTHAAFNRHKSRREEPCAVCSQGEREFQRLRKRTKKVWRVAAEAPRKSVGGCRPTEVMDRSEAAS